MILATITFWWSKIVSDAYKSNLYKNLNIAKVLTGIARDHELPAQARMQIADASHNLDICFFSLYSSVTNVYLLYYFTFYRRYYLFIQSTHSNPLCQVITTNFQLELNLRLWYITYDIKFVDDYKCMATLFVW